MNSAGVRVARGHAFGHIFVQHGGVAKTRVKRAFCMGEELSQVSEALPATPKLRTFVATALKTRSCNNSCHWRRKLATGIFISIFVIATDVLRITFNSFGVV